MAEVYNLVENTKSPSAIFVGWDLFGSRDLTITSWADLDLYNMSYGRHLGVPEFVRVPYTEADGVVIILPRKKGADELNLSEEMVELMIMLRQDDIEFLEQDRTWYSFVI